MEFQNKQEWKVKGIQLGYVLGLSLIIAAIIYFFASNWPGFEKWTKIILSIGLIVLFYVLSFLLNRIMKGHPFLSRLFLFFGCLSFGVGVALLGQIYNSHADSYMLFVVWTIPALLFSYFTKYQPFYVLTYLLIHIAFWFFLFPSSGFHYIPEAFLKWILIGIALLNGLLYTITARQILMSKSLQWLSFIVLHIIMLGLTIGELVDPFNILISVLYVAILIFLYFYHIKNQLHNSYFIILTVASIAFIVIKFIEFLIYMNTEYIFLFTLLLPFVMIGIVMYGLRKWKLHQKGEHYTFFKKMIMVMTIVISSIITASSIFGISLLIIEDISYPFFMFLSIVLILLASIKRDWESIIRYTLLLTAYLIGIPAAITANLLIAILFIAVLKYVFWTFQNVLVRYITYVSILIVLAGSLFEMNYFSKELIIGFIFLINSLVYFVSNRVFKSSMKRTLLNNSMFYAMLCFFLLTFLFEEQPFLYYPINGLYFVITTFLVLLSLKQSFHNDYWMFLAFWFSYIIYKYYDLVWDLLHKSITFLLIGIIVLFITWRFDHTWKLSPGNHVRIKHLSVAIIMAIQFIIIGGQIWKSEILLKNGDLIKLELAPVDPRSLLQGDYLILSYQISSLELDNEEWGNQLQIGLRKNEAGVYEYSGSYVIGKKIPDNMQGKADVWITGKMKGYNNIEYGIENYFVPEGTGLDLQGKVNFAYVRVAANGDAMLVELTEK